MIFLTAENFGLFVLVTAEFAYALVKMEGLPSGLTIALLLSVPVCYGILRRKNATPVPKLVDDLLKKWPGRGLMSFITVALWTPLLAALAFLDFGASPLLWSLYAVHAATLLVLFLIGRTARSADIRGEPAITVSGNTR
jgi:hypothetical protein